MPRSPRRASIGFTAALELPARAKPTIGRDARDLLTGAYGRLVELMPAAFALSKERGRREPIIVRSLLLQVPGVQKVALDKICRGRPHTTWRCSTPPARAKLAETTGLDVEVTARIHDRFQALSPRDRPAARPWPGSRGRAGRAGDARGRALARARRAREARPRLDERRRRRPRARAERSQRHAPPGERAPRAHGRGRSAQGPGEAAVRTEDPQTSKRISTRPSARPRAPDPDPPGAIDSWPT